MKFYFILLFTIISNAQNTNSCGKVFYKKTMLELEETKEDHIYLNAKKLGDSHTHVLEFCNNESFSRFDENLALEASEQDKLNSKISSIFSGDHDFYYDKNTDTGIYCYKDNIKVKQESKINWEITAETKQIDDYLCYKAIYHKKIKNHKGEMKDVPVIAWFAPSIPYSFGPKEYYGLPGLILEVQDKFSTLLAVKIETNIEGIIIEEPKGKVISEEEYRDRMLSN